MLVFAGSSLGNSLATAPGISLASAPPGQLCERSACGSRKTVRASQPRGGDGTSAHGQARQRHQAVSTPTTGTARSRWGPPLRVQFLCGMPVSSMGTHPLRHRDGNLGKLGWYFQCRRANTIRSPSHKSSSGGAAISLGGSCNLSMRRATS